MLWMFIGIAMCAVLTGTMASTFVEIQGRDASIESVRDLHGKRVCGYPITFKMWYLPESLTYTPVYADNVVECGEKIRNGEADVAVMEGVYLSYYLANDGWASQSDLALSESISTVPTGVIFQKDSAYAEVVNQGLLELFDTECKRHDFPTTPPQPPPSLSS